MKNIIVIGNSPAGVKAIELIRSVDQESTISIFSSQEALPCNRQLFPELLAGTIKEADVLYQPESFYKNLKVELALDRKLTRVTPKRNKLVFENKKEEKEEMTFDILVLTDAPTKLPDIKGNHRAGVYGLRRFDEAKQILKNISISETIAVQSDTLWGLTIVEAMRKRNKEVLWIYSGKSLFAPTLDEQSGASLKHSLEAQGIRILEDNAIAEILGDSEAKAIRLKSGKVIGAEMIIFPDSGADLKVYTDAGLAANKGLTINQNFQTSNENVYALDDIGDFAAAFAATAQEGSLALLEEQGKTAGSAIIGQPQAFSSPASSNSLSAELEKRMTGAPATMQ
jgi:NAD(P)H-nitrite reductase large subunit